MIGFAYDIFSNNKPERREVIDKALHNIIYSVFISPKARARLISSELHSFPKPKQKKMILQFLMYVNSVTEGSPQALFMRLNNQECKGLA